jgi:hypothetical protein
MDEIVSVVFGEVVILLGDETDSSSESDTSVDNSESDDGTDSDLANLLVTGPSGCHVS